jgi:hypothetical protein
MWSPSKFIKILSPVSRIPDPGFQGCGSGSGIRCLLRPTLHRDGLELWLRVCGRQVSSSSCITSVANPGSGSGIQCLLLSSHHCDCLELWLRVCGRQVSSSRCITSVADPGSGIPCCGSGSGIQCLLIPSHHCDGLELWLRVCDRQVSSSSCITSIPIRDSSVADPDPGFGAFFALLITVIAWIFGYEYVVAK